MAFTVRYTECRFGGLRQRSLRVEGTTSGGQTWFLRYPDGELAGEGCCAASGGRW
ncbi:MAG: hypothetical protein M3008_04400 [Chloroflexota bacterium]|nr:hypothetical protein [Chloroflexota bacterium]